MKHFEDYSFCGIEFLRCRSQRDAAGMGPGVVLVAEAFPDGTYRPTRVAHAQADCGELIRLLGLAESLGKRRRVYFWPSDDRDVSEGLYFKIRGTYGLVGS